MNINEKEKQTLYKICAGNVLLQILMAVGFLFFSDAVIPQPSALSQLVKSVPYFFCLISLGCLGRNENFHRRVGKMTGVCVVLAALAIAMPLRLWLNQTLGTVNLPLWALLLPREIPILMIFIFLVKIKFSKD